MRFPNLAGKSVQLVAVLVLLCGYTATAMGHAGKPSLVRMQLGSEGAEANLLAHVIDFQRAIPPLEALSPRSSMEQLQQAQRALFAYLNRHFNVSRGGVPCTVEWSLVGTAGDGMLQFSGQYFCPAQGDYSIASELFWEIERQHRTVIAAIDAREQLHTITLSAMSPIAVISGSSSWWATFIHFLWDGLTHILIGLDHVVFVLGLLLICAGFNRRLLLAVTAFTVAHSITLVAAALGKLSVSSAVVEPLIGASIGYLGLEAWLMATRKQQAVVLAVALHLLLLGLMIAGVISFPLLVQFGLVLFVLGYYTWMLRQDAGRITLQVTLLPFVFGLIHGLGFAGPLLGMRLPAERLTAALFGFNLGVELGQVAVLLLAVALVYALRPLWVGHGARLRSWLPWPWMLIGFAWYLSRIAGLE